DGAAFALSSLFWQSKASFDFLILASQNASNETDQDFAQTGASRPQKFVHTLPNVRASMALQAIEKVSEFLCLDNGEQTLSSAFEELLFRSQEGYKPALAWVESRACDELSQKLQSHRAVLISLSQRGDWSLESVSEEREATTDRRIYEQLKNGENRISLGSLCLKKREPREPLETKN
ncbi:MAG: hypothetical protein AAF203_03240, partial [Pseudomonadota bacterium]